MGSFRASLSREKFFLLGGVWLAFMQGEPVERFNRHVAFAVDEAALELYESRRLESRRFRRGSCPHPRSAAG
jgi:hypothetical protein